MISSQNRAVDITIELTSTLVSAPLPKKSFAKCHRLYTLDSTLIQAKYGDIRDEGMKLILDAVMDIIS